MAKFIAAIFGVIWDQLAAEKAVEPTETESPATLPALGTTPGLDNV